MKKGIHSLIFSYILLIVTQFTLFAETPADSLFQQFYNASAKEKVNVANKILQDLYNEEFIDSLYHFTEKNSIDEINLQTFFYIAEKAYSDSHFEMSIIIAKEALLHSRKFKDPFFISDCLSLLGTAYQRCGNIAQSILYLDECYQTDLTLNDKERLSATLNNLTGLYLASNQPEVAEKYILEGIKIERTLNRPISLAIRLGMASDVYIKLKKPEIALSYAKEAYQIDLRDGREVKVAIRLSQMAAAYIDLKNYKEAKNALDKALPVFEKTNNIHSLSVCYNQLGLIELEKKNTNDAIKYFSLAAEYAEKTGNKNIQKSAFKGLWQANSKSNLPQSIYYLEKYVTLTDSMYNDETALQLSNFNVKYQIAEKEFTILMQQQNIEKNKKIQTLLILSIAFVLLAVLLFISLFAILKKRNRELKEINILKDKFFTIISHDLKNPLIAQRNILEMLVKNYGKVTKEIVYQQCCELEKSSESLLELLHNLLAWSRLEARKMNIKPIRFELKPLINEVVELFYPVIKNKKIAIKVTIPDHIFAYSDLNIISTVLRNLLSNAIKYTPNGGRISISVTEENKCWIISISDTGVGMTAETLQSLFSIAKQQITLGTEGEKGTGLGLLVCKEMLELCKSKLIINSSVGKGTVVSFRV